MFPTALTMHWLSGRRYWTVLKEYINETEAISVSKILSFIEDQSFESSALKMFIYYHTEY